MDFKIPDQVKEVVASIDKFIEQEVDPVKKQYQQQLTNDRYFYDENGLYAKETMDAIRKVRKKSAEAGFFHMFADPELGGSGDEFGPLNMVLIHELLYRKHGQDLLTQHIFPIGLFTDGLTPVLKGLKPEVKADILPGVQSGDTWLCFGLSEPDAGSDIWNLKTRAVKDGDHWVLNGTKQWISYAPYSDYAMIFAITDPEMVRQKSGGITCFLVPLDGVTCVSDSAIPLLGNLGGDTGIISLEDARVHEKYIIGDVHQAYKTALDGINLGRLSVAANCVGTAQWALDKAIEYANERKTFGVTIGKHQTIQTMIADCALEIYAAQNMVLHCAWKVENQNKSPVKELSMVKAHATEMTQSVLDKCMQIHGGMGLTNELGLEHVWRWAREQRIPDGTTEMQKRTIAKELLKGGTSFL
ncbi:acyl-CoA dehydrogenase [Lentibacillus kapialis]|uniref:Acyl-CoA dehydrogenase n=1 Tax=Lentibacillus kapialis TaxID=340214 RepID=A0A917UXK8_9BACI|nr:acyl-CoA dehydrogenase family protein [Lentibacillus kapialis]GGJ93521.1 acyl-CoA dehydrogenase [Lentibacillus kapialis]